MRLSATRELKKLMKKPFHFKKNRKTFFNEKRRLTPKSLPVRGEKNGKARIPKVQSEKFQKKQ